VKVDCYIYETRSGWHWEVTGPEWGMSERRERGAGYESREACLKAANRTCEKLGIKFEPEAP